MSGHAFLAPSSASVWAKCHAYPTVAARYPGTGNDASREGTKAHGVAAMYHAFGRELAEAGCDSAEMLDAAKLYSEYLTTLAGGETRVVLEKKVSISRVSERCGGTPDAYVWHAAERHLHVADFKYGHGFVDAYENMQLFLYSIGILDELGAIQSGEPFTVTLHIIQPRCYHVSGPIRSWTVPAHSFAKYLDDMITAAMKATGENPQTAVGDHCRYCEGRHACASLHAAASAASDFAQVATPLEITVAQVGNEITWLREAANLINFRLSGLEEHALSAIRAGKSLPGYRAESEAGRLEWSDSSQMLSLVDEKYRKPIELVTPTQAIKAGLDADFVGAHATRKSGKVKLVKDTNAARFFS